MSLTNGRPDYATPGSYEYGSHPHQPYGAPRPFPPSGGALPNVGARWDQYAMPPPPMPPVPHPGAGVHTAAFQVPSEIFPGLFFSRWMVENCDLTRSCGHTKPVLPCNVQTCLLPELLLATLPPIGASVVSFTWAFTANVLCDIQK